MPTKRTRFTIPSSRFKQAWRVSNKYTKAFKRKSQRTMWKRHVSLTKFKPPRLASRINTKPSNARSRRRRKLTRISSRLQSSIKRKIKKSLKKRAPDEDNNIIPIVKNKQKLNQDLDYVIIYFYTSDFSYGFPSVQSESHEFKVKNQASRDHAGTGFGTSKARSSIFTDYLVCLRKTWLIPRLISLS